MAALQTTFDCSKFCWGSLPFSTFMQWIWCQEGHRTCCLLSYYCPEVQQLFYDRYTGEPVLAGILQ